MATPAGKGYKSDLNLGLPQLPTTTDPELFSSLIEAYNAIHTLNSFNQTLADGVYNNDKDAELPQQLRFTTSLWLPASEPIEAGKVCRFVSNGIRMGQQGPMTSLAMTEAVEEGELIKVGFGPAVLELPGATYGKKYYTHNSEFRGQLLGASIKGAILVGFCFTPGFIIFSPSWFNTKI